MSTPEEWLRSSPGIRDLCICGHERHFHNFDVAACAHGYCGCNRMTLPLGVSDIRPENNQGAQT